MQLDLIDPGISAARVLRDAVAFSIWLEIRAEKKRGGK